MEIQLSEDQQFIETVLKHNSVSDIDENMSDSDTFVIDLDCTGLINDSDDVASMSTNVKTTDRTSHTSGSNNSFKNSDPDMQQAIKC